MKELSLHILDIVQNSISANASLIEIIIEEDQEKNIMEIKIIDNGCGMDKELLEKVTNPFMTTRTTRKVGLGISLFKAAAERCNGTFHIQSVLGKGTEVCAVFERNHIDRAPLGNMPDTIVAIIISNDRIDYVYKHILDQKTFIFNTREIRKIVGDMSLGDIRIIDWMKSYVQDGLRDLTKEES